MTLGPLMIDLCGAGLRDDERELLQHPLVGGVILFTRNYADKGQLAALAGDIHALRTPPLLIAVDHEGGRVQRFREGFTPLPACTAYGQLHGVDRRQALHCAEEGGWIMAAELRTAGIDFSFAPVLDVDIGVSHVIGDRGFHSDPDTVASLAFAFVKGMHAAGMSAVGKHFPGHGSVAADSHHAVPIDEREFAEIEACDIRPFARLIRNGIEGIMPAHVVYSRCDPQPAGFSPFWLKEVLRGRLGFNGVIFSDDVGMAGAAVAGDLTERARAALAAGCDMVLVCNDPDGAARVIAALDVRPEPISRVRLMRMHGRPAAGLADLANHDRWQRATQLLADLNRAPELNLGDDNPV